MALMQEGTGMIGAEAWESYTSGTYICRRTLRVFHQERSQQDPSVSHSTIRPSSIDQSFSALASGPTAMPLQLCLEAELNHRALTTSPLYAQASGHRPIPALFVSVMVDWYAND